MIFRARNKNFTEYCFPSERERSTLCIEKKRGGKKMVHMYGIADVDELIFEDEQTVQASDR